MISENLINPFNADPTVELARKIEEGRPPLWTEYCYFFCYDTKAEIGLTLHAGREPEDPRIWRATIVVYQPNSELLVAKYTGRDGDDRGAGAGPLKVSCVDPMRLWTLDFDGSMQRTTRAVATHEAHRDSVGEIVDFHLLFEGAAPFWDMHQDQKVMDKQSWAGEHYEQICKVRGSFTVKGKTIAFDGAGVRDHSAGPRDYAPVVGNFWMNAYFPKSGTAIMAQHTLSENMGSEIRQGYIFRNDGSPLEVVKVKTCPAIATLETADRSIPADPLDDADWREFVVELETKAGVERIEAKLLHTGPTTYISPSDELVGTDLTRPDALQLTESVAVMRWNGEDGLGVRERIVRHAKLR